MNEHGRISGEITSLSTTRRGFVALGAVAAIPGGTAMAAAAPREIGESAVTVPGNSGPIDATVIRPSQGDHPGLVMWAPPSAGAREVARQLAAQGWSVLLVRERILTDRAQQQEARALVAWLSRQDGVLPPAQPKRADHGIGHGYVLRSVSSAQPRLSLVSREQRSAAARSAWLFAVPELAPLDRSTRMEQIAAAVGTAFRVGAIAA